MITMNIIQIILIYLITKTNCKIPLKNHTAEKHLAIFTIKTYSLYCAEGKTTLIINHRNNAVCDKFLKHVGKLGYTMPFYVYMFYKPYIKSEYEGAKADLTILFLDTYNTTNILSRWKDLEIVPLYKTFSKYLLIFCELSPKDYSWIEEVFKSFWSKKILRVFIAFWDDGLKVFTFDPFRNNFKIDITHLNDTMKKITLEYELFNLYGYPMMTYLWDESGYENRLEEKVTNSGRIDYIGYDGKLLTQVRNVLNVSLIITRESDEHTMNKYGEYMKKMETSLQEMYVKFLNEYNFDIFFTATRTKGYCNCDNIFLQERDDYVILVPVGEKVPEYIYILLIIQPNLLILTYIHMIAVALALYLIRQVKQFKNKYVVDAVSDVYKIIINIPMAKSNDNFQERLVLSVWIIYSIVYSVIFNSTMVSTLVVPKYFPNLNKIEDLVKTNITVYSTLYDYSLVKNSLTGNDVKLLKKLEVFYGDNFYDAIYGYQNSSGFMMRYERAREFLKVTKKIGKTRFVAFFNF